MKATRKRRLEEHLGRNCLFCQPKFREKESYRILNVRYPKDCFAILDMNPKILGHSLVITSSPFNDLTDKISDVGEEEKTKTFESAVDLARRIEHVLGAEKVYIMLMCEKWEMWETGDYSTTEHFHFHLVPRYAGMRNKSEAAEQLLAREGIAKDKVTIERIAQLLNRSK